MRMFSNILAATAVLTTAAPAAAQYYGYSQYGNGYNQYGNGYSQYGNGYNQYGSRYTNRYNNQYSAYGYGVNTSAAASQCTAAVQNRLYNRSSIGGILGAVLGTNTSGQVLSVTQVNPRSNGTVRVRGLASSGRYASRGYGAYGVGAYGASGYGYANAADLSFRCDVGPNGAIYDVSINRR